MSVVWRLDAPFSLYILTYTNSIHPEATSDKASFCSNMCSFSQNMDCVTQVLETCVKNCGHRFHVLVASQEFVEGVLVRSILPKNNPPTVLHDRVLSLIQVGAAATNEHFHVLIRYYILELLYLFLYDVNRGKLENLCTRCCNHCVFTCLPYIELTNNLLFAASLSSKCEISTLCLHVAPSKAFLSWTWLSDTCPSFILVTWISWDIPVLVS